MDKQHLDVFKKIEQQVADAEEKVRRDELEKERALLRAAQLRRQRIRERCILGVTFSFSFGLIFLAWYTEGAVVRKAGGMVRSVSSSIMGGGDTGGGAGGSLDCAQPGAMALRQCQEERKYKTQADWSGISLYDDGKENPFALHKKR